ncbi:hypothetical protein [uncultured Mediterranean phage uvMED]|nr:hypothetical protein [uncultured Mediterranean phage uvMED]
MKTPNQIEIEKNSPHMADLYKDELVKIRKWLETCPIDYFESLLKSGQLTVSFELSDYDYID